MTGSSPEQIGGYRILGVLGSGAMGTVYDAVHTDTGAQVALKALHVPKEIFVPTLRREIRTLSRVRHPGVVRLVDQGMHEGLPWYAMERIDGDLLSARIGDPGLAPTETQPPLQRGDVQGVKPAPPPVTPEGAAWVETEIMPTLSIIRRLCDALAYLHGEGIIHRDVKPDNVIVRPDGQPVLVDFGVITRYGGATSRESLVVETTAIGTLSYMAPEQIQGGLVDARADLYSLGCVLYHAVTGRPPFRDSSVIGLARAHLMDDPVPPSHVRPHIDPRLDELVLALLAKRPADRLGYASDVADRLEALGATGDTACETPTPRSYLYRPLFVGRQPSYNQLVDVIDRSRRGEGAAVFIGGESGVGKTRLALEAGRYANVNDCLVLTGECLPPSADQTDPGGGEGLLVPLGAFRDPLLALVDRCREWGERETMRIFGARADTLARYLPEVGDLEGVRLVPFSKGVSPGAARRRLIADVADTLAALTKDGAVLLVLDDLQWADALSRAVIDHLVKSDFLARHPLVLLGTYRLEELDPELESLMEGPQAQPLTLNRLDADAIRQMVGDMLALSPPVALVEMLEAHSEGNPFFVAEFLRMLVEDGALERDDDGRWTIHGTGSLSEDAMPGSLRDLVTRRLMVLPERSLALVQAASVVGRLAPRDLLSHITGLDEEALREALEPAQRRQVLEEDHQGRLRFVHDKLREAAYAQVDEPRRRTLHQAIAEVLERRASTDASEAATLGHHWACAGEDAKARGFYRQAILWAGTRDVPQRTEALVRSYLTLVETPDTESVEMRTILAHMLMIQSRRDESMTEVDLSMDESKAIGDPRAYAFTYHVSAMLAWRLGDLERSHAMAAKAQVCYDEIGDEVLLGSMYTDMIVLYWSLGEHDKAKLAAMEALRIHRKLGHTTAEASLLNRIALVLVGQGKLDEPLPMVERALGMHRAANSGLPLAWSLLVLGRIHRDKGHVDEARSYLMEAVAVSRRMAGTMVESASLIASATLERREGDLEEAAALLRQAEQICQATEEPIYGATCAIEQGHLALAWDQDADDYLTRARARAHDHGNEEGRSELSGRLARLAKAIEARGAGVSLIHGEHPDALPVGHRPA